MSACEDDAAFHESAAREAFGTVAAEELHEFTIEPIEEFSAVDEPGANAVLGTADQAMIAEGSDAMIYGDGGAGKTTLIIDLGCALTSGADWLGTIPVPRAVRLLWIENEGPRALFRRKTRRKLAAWPGPPVAGRFGLLADPWCEFSFNTEAWRAGLAAKIRSEEIDVIVAGPLTKLGMDEAGTLQQVRDFMRLINDVRTRCGRRLTVILIHHENRAGAVSGAWEGAGDTLLHVREAGHGHTVVYVQKARWGSDYQGTSLKLTWTAGEGFELEGARDLHAEIKALLGDGKWRTAKEIATPRDKPEPGVGAGVDAVKAALKADPDVFIECKGDEVGRSHNAKVYGLTLPQKSDESDGVSPRAAGASDSNPYTPVGGGGGLDTAPPSQNGVTSQLESDIRRREKPGPSDALPPVVPADADGESQEDREHREYAESIAGAEVGS